VEYQIDHRAKAMIVTRSRLHAVRYKQALDQALRAKGLPYKALVAFSGTVEDGGAHYTEAGMNGFSDKQTARTFRQQAYRFLVVAEKFQTGFDEPLLHTMYVDKKLSGVNAVQTLSRLNRTHPGKKDPLVLDFANDVDEIRDAFQPYYDKTLLSAPTDPNLVYDRERELYDFHLFTKDDVQAFAMVWFGATDKDRQQHARFYKVLDPVKDRFAELAADQQERIRSALADYVRLFVFISQLLTFADADLEKLYHFARFLRRRVRADKDELPREVLQAVDMESYRVQRTSKGKIELAKQVSELEPLSFTGPVMLTAGEEEPLSQIIRELNERFGTDFTEEDRVVVRGLYEALAGDEALVEAVRVNPPENARLTFEHKAKDRMQGLVDTNFKLYKRITDDEAFAKVLLDMLFTMFRARAATPSAEKEPPETRTSEDRSRR
jgi:type I restriction enzyme R subunit